MNFGFSQLNYISSYSKVKQIAKEENKLIFAYFTASWCAPCKKMEADIKQNEALLDFMNKELVIWKIDCTSKNSTASMYKVNGLPTVIFLDHENKEISRFSGYADIRFLENNIYAAKEKQSALINMDSFSQMPVAKAGPVLEEYLVQHPATIKFSIHKLWEVNDDWKNYIADNHHLSIDYNNLLTYLLKKKKNNELVTNRKIENLMKARIEESAYSFNFEAIKTLAIEISETSLISKEKALAYMINYHEHIRMNLIRQVSDTNTKVYSKDLVKYYPETDDVNLLEIVFCNLIENKIDTSFLLNIQPTFEKLSTEKKDYLYFDILSYINFRLGKKEMAYKMSAKCKETAMNQGYNNRLPFLRKYRDLLTSD